MNPTTETIKTTKINDHLIEQLSKNKGWDTLEKIIQSSTPTQLNYQRSSPNKGTNVQIPCSINIGSTVLFWACIFNKHKIVKALIDAKADVNLQTDDGFTPITGACQSSANQSLNLLIAAGADVNSKHGDISALMEATIEGTIETVELLIQANVDLEYKDNDGYTALARLEDNVERFPMNSCADEYKAKIKLLVDAGAKVEQGPYIDDIDDVHTAVLYESYPKLVGSMVKFDFPEINVDISETHECPDCNKSCHNVYRYDMTLIRKGECFQCIIRNCVWHKCPNASPNPGLCYNFHSWEDSCGCEECNDGDCDCEYCDDCPYLECGNGCPYDRSDMAEMSYTYLYGYYMINYKEPLDKIKTGHTAPDSQ